MKILLRKIAQAFAFLITFSAEGQILMSDPQTALAAELDLGVERLSKSWGSIYYQPGSGLLNYIMYNKRTRTGEIYTIDPVNTAILGKNQFPMKKKDTLGSGAISPDGRYLAVDKWNNKKVTVFDLTSNKTVMEFAKADAARSTKAGFFGLDFIDDKRYVLSEGKASQLFMHSNIKGSAFITTRTLPSNEVVDQWAVPDIDMNVHGGISNVAHHPVSPWGVPILAVLTHLELFVYNYETKERLIKFDVELPKNFVLSFSLKDYVIVSDQVYDLKSGELIAMTHGGEIVESSETEFLLSLDQNTETIKLLSFELPEQLEQELAYKNWLIACKARQAALAEEAANASPSFQMNSPNNDWVYLGDQGANGLANGIGDAIRKDGLRFITNGTFVEGEFISGRMENVYEVTMEGDFVNMRLNGLGRHVTENKAILEGEFTDGLLNGQGESIDPSGLQYVGSFKNGAFEGKGKITRPDGEVYEGEFSAGKPHGMGIYKSGSTIERVEYYDGQRIDQAYQIRKENERVERQRKLEQLQAKRRAEYLAKQQKKRSSNRLFAALALGIGAGMAGTSVGMDSMQAMEFSTAMFQDVMSGGTSNLTSLSNKWETEFNAKRARYTKEDPAYTRKAQEIRCNVQPLNNSGVCSVYNLNNYQSMDLIGDSTVDRLCANAMNLYDMYKNNACQPGARNVDTVYRQHLQQVGRANNLWDNHRGGQGLGDVNDGRSVQVKSGQGNFRVGDDGEGQTCAEIRKSGGTCRNVSR